MIQPELLLSLLLGLYSEPAPGPPVSEPLRVLFLGDQGHHRPSERAAQIMPVLSLRGVETTYTESLRELDLKRLSNYDVLLIYANIERIEPAQEQALFDYVEAGGGLVAVHCASFCFLNSSRYVQLIGAQFARHGTGEFETRVIDSEHPIMQGIRPFRTWDETYVHHRHHPEGRQVLQVRDEDGRAEPWTWVRLQGKGRVFYTAYGHDARTWQNPGFHDLLERGIRWAAGRGPVFDSRPRPAQDLPPVTYEEAAAPIPNYLPGAKWGTQGEPYRRMPRPLSPEQSRQHLALPGEIEAHLFAAEPSITRPICMTWDHRGRLWIAESVDYPNDQRDGPGNDRIKICEDRDGDGVAETFTVFAEGLNIPTSLCVTSQGVVVLQAPDTLLLCDRDGDDRADDRRVLFTGWGTLDTHAGPSNLRWGLDNWIWGIVGYSAFRGEVGGQAHSFGQGFFRFTPDGSRLEFLRSTSNNSWGLGFSEEGLVFGSTANGCPSVFLAVPNRYYESVRGWSPSVLERISVNNQFFPITDRVRQVDWHGGFTAAAGHALYTARRYPRPYWNRTAFVAEPTGHLVAAFTLHPRGSDFTACYGWNLLASDDEWTAPIMAEVGPDGNVWVIDWYNYIVQHNPTPEGFKTGKGNAYETPLRDRTRGRIYRLIHGKTPSAHGEPLDPTDPASLVARLADSNQFWRLQAQRLLVERGKADVKDDLIRLASDRGVDEIGLNAGAIHALWTLRGLGMLEDPDSGALPAARAALSHPSSGVRRTALMVLPRDSELLAAMLAAKSLSDPDPHVRLAAFLALAEAPSSPGTGRALVSALLDGVASNDRWLTDAVTSAAAAHDSSFLRTLAETPLNRAVDPLPQVARRVAEHLARGAAEHLARGAAAETALEIVRALSRTQGEFASEVAQAILDGLSQGWPHDLQLALDPDAEAELLRLAAALPLAAKASLVRLAGQWGSAVLDGTVEEIIAHLTAEIRDESREDAGRIESARRLVRFRPTDDRIPPLLLQFLSPRTSPALAEGIIASLALSSSPAVPQTLTTSLETMTPSSRNAAIRLLLARGDWTRMLLSAIEDGRIRLSDLSLDQREALAAHPSRAIAAAARRLLSASGGLPDRDRQKVIDELAPFALQGGDPIRGRQVFQEHCSKCHRHGNEGGLVGPDLTGMSSHPRNELLIHILDPSRSVEGNYTQYIVATRDGRVVNGLIASESRTTLELLDAEGNRQVVLRDDVEELTTARKSLMPEGFEKQIDAAGLADLLSFLTHRETSGSETVENQEPIRSHDASESNTTVPLQSPP